MKFIVSQISYFFQNRGAKRNIRYLVVFLLVMIAMITVYSVMFHWIMAYEGQDHSWITGFYWVLTVMSTLGFGDITFNTDLGKIFSIIVLLSGVVFLLILLPFTFIQFFYSPWIDAQNKSRALRELEPYISGHVIFTSYDENYPDPDRKNSVISEFITSYCRAISRRRWNCMIWG
jgi:voltage-gated potassium channel